MNNKILLIFISLIIVFLVCGATGCEKFPKMPWQKDREVVSSGRGVSAQFRTSEPPLDGIYASEKDNFKVAIDLTNHGQEPVEVTACISDTPSDYFSTLKKQCGPKTVPAAEKVNEKVYPGRAVLDFGKFHYYIDKVTEGMTTNIMVDMKTTYHIKLSPQICIKRPDAEVVDVYCEDESTISGSDLGIDASTVPVTVTKVEKHVWPIDENTFNIHLRLFLNNLGSGKLYDNNEPTRQILKAPKVELIGVGKFDCMTEEIYLDEGERAVTCDKEVTLEMDEAVRRNPILISFDYTYKVLASTGEIPIIVPKRRSTTQPVEGSPGAAPYEGYEEEYPPYGSEWV